MGIFSWFGSRRLSRSRSGGRADGSGRLRSLVAPAGHDSPKDEEIKRAAAADVARVEQDDKYFSPDSPGDQDDDL